MYLGKNRPISLAIFKILDTRECAGTAWILQYQCACSFDLEFYVGADSAMGWASIKELEVI